jgi:hypothetical protein
VRLLHITNGSTLIEKMREAGVAGRIVPWNDVLHEGPVPAGLNPAALRELRADFLATWGDQPRDVVARELRERDDALDDLAGIDEVVLWFEHDLYDQLQLIQVLERLPVDRGAPVTAVPGDDYLGPQPPERFPGLFLARREVTSAQQIAARDAWDAFRASDPRPLVDALDRVTALPHLASALRRHLQQFPSVDNGLSRTEQQTLETLARGAARVKDAYVQANHEREEAVFMADSVFLWHIRSLVQSPRPLIGSRPGSDAAPSATSRDLRFDDELYLTDDGRRVLDGQADRVALCGIDRWLGGVHLVGCGPVFRWDERRGTVRTL